MEIKQLKTVVVGCGVISDIYIQNLQNRFKVIDMYGCSDRNEWKRNAKAEKYGIKSLSFDEILADDSIDMVVNLTSPVAHYEITKACLEKGKHVFSEKMIAVELEDGKDLLKIADEHGVRLGVAPDTFLGAGIQTARYIVDHGLIGTPTSALASISRNYEIFGNLLPHLIKWGGNLPFDVGCYYLTALASILGPAESVMGMGRIMNPERVGNNLDKPWFGEKMVADAENILTGTIKYANGVLCSVHVNGETIIDEHPVLRIYGTEGIVEIADPNEFGCKITLYKPMAEPIVFPFTHGFAENSRGVACAEMAWAIAAGREHRASKEMAYHVFEELHGMTISARTGELYRMKSTFEVPEALPQGFIGNGFWGPTEETALI